MRSGRGSRSQTRHPVVAFLVACLAVCALSAGEASADYERVGVFEMEPMSGIHVDGNVIWAVRVVWHDSVPEPYWRPEIAKYTTDGALLDKWVPSGKGDPDFPIHPSGITTDRNGNVVVISGLSNVGGSIGFNCDRTVNRCVYVFSPDGTLIRRFGTGGWNTSYPAGTHHHPSGVATDSQGFIYVADGEGARVVKYDAGGLFVDQWSMSHLSWNPRGVFVDEADHVFVSQTAWVNNPQSHCKSQDICYHSVYKFDSHGNLLSTFGKPGSGMANEIVVDRRGNVFTTHLSQWVRLWTPLSDEPTSIPIPTDGASVTHTKHLGVDNDGTLYVGWSNKITKLRYVEPPKSTVPPPKGLPAPRARINGGPSGKTNKRKATFTFSADQPNSAFHCRLVGKRAPQAHKRWTACSSPATYRRLKPGKKRFQVRAVKEGRVGPIGARRFKVVAPPARSKPAKPGRPSRPNLPVRTIPVRGKAGSLTLTCPQANRCRGRITIQRGRVALVQPREYSIRQFGKLRLSLKLTPKGRAALSRSGKTRGKGLMKAKNGKKSSFIAILKRR